MLGLRHAVGSGPWPGVEESPSPSALGKVQRTAMNFCVPQCNRMGFKYRLCRVPVHLQHEDAMYPRSLGGRGSLISTAFEWPQYTIPYVGSSRMRGPSTNVASGSSPPPYSRSLFAP